MMYSGSGNATFFATDFLSTQLTGSGDIKSIGTPSKIDLSVNGSDKITKVG